MELVCKTSITGTGNLHIFKKMQNYVTSITQEILEANVLRNLITGLIFTLVLVLNGTVPVGR